MRLTTLAKYEADHEQRRGPILPIVPTFAFSFKVAEDTAATLTPTLFLRSRSGPWLRPTTQPLSASDLQLAPAFNQDFAAAQQAGRHGNPVPLAQDRRRRPRRRTRDRGGLD